MELRAGYKNTEIGVIPEDWEVKTYDDVFDFLATATYSRAELTEIDKVRYVHYGDIHTKWNFFLDIPQSNLPTVRDEQVKNYHLLKDGDVIMADASEDYPGIGKSVEVKNLGSVKAISGLHTFLFRDKNEVFVNGFRGYIHFNKIVKTQFDRLATGLKVYGVSKGNLKTVLIPVPTRTEQAAIATALSDADSLISSLEKLIVKKSNIKLGAMQKLLIPNVGWKNEPIKNLASISTGDKNTQDKIDEGAYPFFVRSQNIEKLNSYSFEGEAILIAGDGVGTGKVMHYYNGKFDFHQRVYKLSDFQNIINGLHFFLFFKNNFYNRMMQMTAKSSVDSIRRDMISEMIISFPNIEKQIRIATILSDMDAEINALEAKLDKYKKIKLGMVQNLLTGKIRLV